MQIRPESGTQVLNPGDPRTRIVLLEQSREQELNTKGGKANGNGVQVRKGQATSSTELMVYVLGAFGAIVGLSCMIVWAVLKYTEA